MSSGCHDSGTLLDGEVEHANRRRIALVGNPNCGKSVVFGALTGRYVDVSNFPGTTLDISRGRLGEDVLIDTPGVYGISSFNDEERVTRETVVGADVIVNIVNGVFLERDLFLTCQLLDMGLPLVVGVNMMDELERNGLALDLENLQKELGVPVVPLVAVRGEGLFELRRAVAEARPGKVDPALADSLENLSRRHGVEQRQALLLLEGDEATSALCGTPALDQREETYRRRRERVDGIVARSLHEVATGAGLAVRLGRALVRPASGLPILAVVLGIAYYLIGVGVAQGIVGLTEGRIMRGYYEPFIRAAVGLVVPSGSWLGTILVGEFGVLTMTMTYVVGLLLPLVIAFYLVLSLMEDSGYLPRVAALTDRLLTGLGLNGRAIIPVILGFGCVTMATITTRLLGSPRERTIATALLGLTIPCSAQMAVIASLIAPLGPVWVTVYAAIILILFIGIGTFLNRLLPGKSSDFLIDLPPMRLPRLDNVARKTYMKTKMFVKEATPLFALGAFLVGLMQVTGVLLAVQDAFAPLTVGVLKLPKEAATAFVMGLVRRDFGAAGFYSMSLTAGQTLTALVVITLFVPCIASVTVMFKERGWREAASIWFGSWILAFVVGGLVAQFV